MTSVTLQPHQQRVVEEKRDLDEKTGRLAAFLETKTYDALVPEERGRLRSQLFYMRRYADVLGERIAAF